jgi:hypothetical protein
MYECFMQMLDRAREVPDKLQQDALVSLAEEAEDLWQRTLLEMQVAYCLLETLSLLSLPPSLSLSLSLSFSLSLSLSHTHTHSLSLTHTHTLSLSLALSRSLFKSPCFMSLTS